MILGLVMAQSTRKTVELPQMTRAASIVPSTLNDSARTVDVVWTTGARVMRGFFDRYWEQLSLDPKNVRMKRLNNGAPFLDDHNADGANSVLGVVEPGSATVDGKRGVATVRFARAEDDPVADQIYRKIKDGIIQNISVGYQVYSMTKISDGGSDKVPIYEVDDWEPMELTVTPIGADDGAGFRSASSNERTTCVITTTKNRTKETTMDDEETPAGGTPGESPAIAATRAANEARAAEATARAEAQRVAAAEAVATERTRIAEIRKIAKRSKLGDTWAQTLIEAGTSVEEARSAALEHLIDDDEKAPTSGIHGHIGAGDDERDKFIRGASAWMFSRTGVRSMLEQAKRKAPEMFRGVEFDPGPFAGDTPVDLARKCLERAGVNTRGMSRMDLVGRAFTQRSANFQTAGDFPILLENVLGKVLLGAYAVQPNTWERICKVDQVPDFRTSNRYRSASVPGLDVIAEHGEYKNGVIPDGAKYGIVTKRMGKIFALSREAIINDDMGALTDLATKLGQAGMRSIENAVYALINANSGLGPTQTDSQPFFHANRANVNATGSALDVAGIDADASVLAQQKDPNGQDFLDLMPAVLLVPRALRGTALVTNEAQYDTASSKFQVPNRVRGMFREVIGTPRLTGTRRYIIADPLDWIVVAFLEGYGQGPVLESQDGWRIDGVEWKVTIYANAQMGDPKAAVTNAGV